MSNHSKKNRAAAALGRKGGSVVSPAKRAAARKNLQKARKMRWVDTKRLV
jgi:hypothetical protein